MIEYYKDSDNNYYRLICRAKDGVSNGNEIAVLQGLNKIGKLLAVSLRLDEYNKIDNDEEIMQVLANCPIDLNPKYRFPYIKYKKRMPKMRKPGERFSKSVQSMITLLTKDNPQKGSNYKYFDKGYLEKYKNDDKLEKEALDRIIKHNEGECLEEIFHLILWLDQKFYLYLKLKNRIL